MGWNGGGKLEAAAAVTGPWTAVANTSSPITVKPEGEQRFYRIIQ
jgi:hypothetical protein